MKNVKWSPRVVLPVVFPALLLLAASPLQAQQVSLGGFILPNYDTIPVGRFSGLEGGAYVARADDTSANWYNPAGLTRAETATFSADSAIYQWTSMRTDFAESATGSTVSFDHVPAFIGAVVPIKGHEGKLVGGFSVTKRVAWGEFIDQELFSSQGTGQLRAGLGSENHFDVLVPGIGLGYAAGGKWRVGAGLGVPIVSFDRNDTLSLRLTDGAAYSSALQETRATGWEADLQLSLGVQYDATPELSFGALLRPPGVRLFGTSSFTSDSLVAVPGKTVDMSIRDESSDFKYRVPLEFDIGAAWHRGKLQLEADLKMYKGVSEYTLLATDQSYTVVTTTAAGSQVSTLAAGPVTTGARSLVNIALGGRYALSKVTTLHAGFYTNRSPVSSESNPMFTEISLTGATVGATFGWRHVGISAGVAYTAGTSSPVAIGGPFGNVVSTPIVVNKLSILYSLSYTF
jgi:long-subunit fatty acid transport protein